MPMCLGVPCPVDAHQTDAALHARCAVMWVAAAALHMERVCRGMGSGVALMDQPAPLSGDVNGRLHATMQSNVLAQISPLGCSQLHADMKIVKSCCPPCPRAGMISLGTLRSVICFSNELASPA